MERTVTIVIVTKNGRNYLPDCLVSLEKQDYPRDLVKTIIVDNDSTDSTVGYVKEKFPQIKVITNKKNSGFAVANNQGYFLAKKQGADYLVLLNQDTIVKRGWLSRLVALAEADKEIAAVQPKILLHPQTEKLNSLGNSIQYLGFAYCQHNGQQDKNDRTDLWDLPYPSGAAVLLKVSALEKTGLFDDRFFMYHEDVDLGWRLRLAGYRIVIDPLSVVYHKYSYRKSSLKFYHLEKNRLTVLLQNYSVLTLILLFPMLLFAEIMTLVYSIFDGWFYQKLKSWFWVVFHLPIIISNRINVQFRIRKVKDRDIVKLFVGEIKSSELGLPIPKKLVNILLNSYWLIVKRFIFW